jgi:uncharacterized protein YlxW (UPF0749 family)
MKRSLLSVVALSAVFLTAGFVLGQTKAAAPAPAPKQQKVVLVRTLNTVKEVQEFQANVQMLQAQRQAAQELANAVAKETDAKKKKDLQTRLDAVLAKLNENNAAMEKAYGFSITRNYTLEIEKANVYMLVTDEEAAKIEAAQKHQKK